MVAPFLGALFPHPAEGFLELRAFPSSTQTFMQPDAHEKIEQFILAHLTENVYFGVATRVPRNGNLAGSAAHCRHVHALWADIDFKNTPEADARAQISSSPIAPSIVVHTGGGLHLYFLLADPLAADTTLKSWLRRLARAFNADLQVAEPARIMRLPGTINTKYSPTRLARLEMFEPTRRYALADFSWLPEEPTKARDAWRAVTGERRGNHSAGVVDHEKAASILANLWPDGQRHAFARHLGGWFANTDIAEDVAVLLVRAAAEKADDDEPDDRERAVRDSYTRFAAGAAVTGLPTACEIVPELSENADVLKDALGIVPVARTSVVSVDYDLTETPPDEPLALPADARIGLAKVFADLYSDAYEAPWESFYFAFLTHFGARVAKHVRLDNELNTEPRLYTILLGQSARARKTQAIKVATKDFEWADLGHDPLNDEPGRFPIIEGIGSGEGLAQAIRDAPKQAALLQIDEFGHLAAKMRIEASSLTSILLTLFDSVSWNNRVKGKGANDSELRGASLSLLTACVAEAFPLLFDPRGGADQGLVNRLWLVTGPTSAEPKPDPRVDPSAKYELRRRLHRLVAAYQRMGAAQTVPARMTDDARKLHRDWYIGEFHPNKDETMSRLDTYVARFMLLLAACANQQPGIDSALVITPDIAQATISMARWQYRVRQQLTPIVADTSAAKIEQTILRAVKQARQGVISERDLRKRTNAYRAGIGSWKKSLDALVQNHHIATLTGAKDGAKGRPASPLYRLGENAD